MLVIPVLWKAKVVEFFSLNFGKFDYNVLFYFFFEMKSCSVARLECSGAILAHFASWVQAILQPQPPE